MQIRAEVVDKYWQHMDCEYQKKNVDNTLNKKMGEHKISNKNAADALLIKIKKKERKTKIMD